MSEEPPSPGIAVSVVVQDRAWNELLPRPEFVAEQASRATLDDHGVETSQVGRPHGAELCIVLASDELVQRLNREYRQVDATTNVLSFANLDGPPAAAPDAPRLLGDVVLARETVQKEAREQDKTMTDHLSHLVVHGVLHLLGYDHQDDRDADKMEVEGRPDLKKFIQREYRDGWKLKA